MKRAPKRVCACRKDGHGFRARTSGSATNGTTTTAYNPLNRPNRITQPDGSSATTPESGATSCGYAGDGLRVEESSGTLYWPAYTGQVIEETNTSGGVQRDYIFLAGCRIAWKDSSGNVYYYFLDAIGSTRAVADSSGNVCFSADYYPYGQENDYDTSCSPTYKFTGYEYDSETGNYYAYARYYNPRLGRFMSADPLAGSVDNPQSLNRYAYVLNNSESFIDPFGLQCFENGDPTSCPPSPPQCFQLVYCEGGSGGGTGGTDNPPCSSVAVYGSGGDMAARAVFADLLYGAVGCQRPGTDHGPTRVQKNSPQTQGPRSSIGPAGGTWQAPTSIGLVNLAFDGQQYLTGIGVPLTGSKGVTVGGYHVPPNTLFGAQLLAGRGVSPGFNNPAQSPGFTSGEITTARLPVATSPRSTGPSRLEGSPRSRPSPLPARSSIASTRTLRHSGRRPTSKVSSSSPARMSAVSRSLEAHNEEASARRAHRPLGCRRTPSGGPVCGPAQHEEGQPLTLGRPGKGPDGRGSVGVRSAKSKHTAREQPV